MADRRSEDEVGKGLTEAKGGIVSYVEPDSIAEEAGILPGDILVSINGHQLTDIIDYRFYSAEEDVDLLVRRDGEEAVISVEKDDDEPLGMEFTDELFDGVRTCGNRCIFCFVSQLPKGMRRTLYIKDDDYRLSFLHGNFVTLTNVSKSDITRVIEQRLTPLFVSVHTTEPALRTAMVRGKVMPDVMEQLRALSAGGITLHTQIVLCPDVNDEEHLRQTVHDLSSLYPSVASIGIVPVGLTTHRQTSPKLTSIDPTGAAEVIRKVRGWQRDFKSQFGTRLVWASDELYLVSGFPIPSAESYEGYPQIENGIGLVRRFVEDEKKALRRLPLRFPKPTKVTAITSTLAAPVLQTFADKVNRVKNLDMEVAVIKNHFFGETVTVAGLITGTDIRDQLSGRDLGDMVIIPATMLRDGAFLDDITVGQLSNALGKPVVAVPPMPSGLTTALADL